MFVTALTESMLGRNAIRCVSGGLVLAAPAALPYPGEALLARELEAAALLGAVLTDNRRYVSSVRHCGEITVVLFPGTGAVY